MSATQLSNQALPYPKLRSCTSPWLSLREVALRTYMFCHMMQAEWVMQTDGHERGMFEELYLDDYPIMWLAHT